jgi:hypothetical protein
MEREPYDPRPDYDFNEPDEPESLQGPLTLIMRFSPYPTVKDTASAHTGTVIRLAYSLDEDPLEAC